MVAKKENNTMANDKTKDLQALCTKYSLTFPREAMNAFEGKRNSLALLMNMIDDINIEIPNNMCMQVGNVELNPKNNGATCNITLKATADMDAKPLHQAAIYVEAFVMNVFALTDIQAEIIKTVFSITLGRDTSFWNVKNKLNQNDNKQKDLKNKMEDICNSDYYNYMRKLVNYVKHRSCVVTPFRFGTDINKGLYVKDFTDKNGNKINGCSCKDLYNKYEGLYKSLIGCYNSIFEAFEKC